MVAVVIVVVVIIVVVVVVVVFVEGGELQGDSCPSRLRGLGNC